MDVRGVHVLAEMSGCEAARLRDSAALGDICVEAARRAGATVLAVNAHQFAPVGASVLLFLAESHLSLHTWPEARYAALDVYTCGDDTDPMVTIAVVQEFLQPETVSLRKFARGERGLWGGYRAVELSDD